MTRHLYLVSAASRPMSIYVSLYVTPRPTNVDFVCTNLKIAVDIDGSSRFALPNCVSKFRSLSTVTSGNEVGTKIQRIANHTLSLDQPSENFMQRNVKTSLFDVRYWRVLAQLKITNSRQQESFLRSQHLHFSSNSPHFKEPKSSLPCSQQPANYPYPSQFNIIDAPPYLYQIHSNIILSSTWLLSFRFPHHNSLWTGPLPHTCHICCPSHPSHSDHQEVHVIKRLMLLCPVPLLLALRHKYVPKHQFRPSNIQPFRSLSYDSKAAPSKTSSPQSTI